MSKRIKYHTPLKLDVGCGKVKREGFTGLDIMDFGQGIVCNIFVEGIPVQDNVVTKIICYHFMEHVNWDRIRGVIFEMYRVCKPGAEIHIKTPHGDSSLAYKLSHVSSWDEKIINGIEASCRNSAICNFKILKNERVGEELHATLEVMKIEK